ncbi:MAG: efflux transporter outer membrane subunit [Opitutus sp.]
MKSAYLLLILSSAAFGALPAVGPNYTRPSASVPSQFRDAEQAVAWKTAEPADAFARGEWWQLFADPALNELETRALSANQDLRGAAARVEQARAAAGIVRGSYRPQVAVGAGVTRERTSRTTTNVAPTSLTTTYSAPLDASWELDLFGRVRRLSESARAEAEASAAAFESVRLALTADVANNYFSLRALDLERASVSSGIELRRRALNLITSRRTSGTATDFDVARAETELASTEAEIAGLDNDRAALQNALAVLVGEAASSFAVPAAADSARTFASVPAIPSGLPATLLERRPDIAAAERALAAANARIGVAKAAFFPSISLTGSAGFVSGDIDRLTHADSRVWSIGPTLYLPIFQGGRNRANLARSRAAYDEAVAVYRQQVLLAFRDVQDALTSTRLLNDQAAAQDRALLAARRAGSLAQTRFDAGYVNLLEVLDAQRTVLTAERAAARLAGQRLTTSVALIKSLGGGWHAPKAGVRLAQQ